MENTAKQFEHQQEAFRRFKMAQIVRRSLVIQARSKIKPTIMNPNLLTMSKLRGSGNVQPLEIYWPGT
jgi:hypothetical protein